MTALLTLLILTAFGYAIHRFAPRPRRRILRPDRLHAHAPGADRSASRYDDQRRYSDLAAIQARFGPEEDTAATREETHSAPAASRLLPIPGAAKASLA